VPLSLNLGIYGSFLIFSAVCRIPKKYDPGLVLVTTDFILSNAIVSLFTSIPFKPRETIPANSLSIVNSS